MTAFTLADAPVDQLVPLYDRLRSLAARFLVRERIDHTLQPTALAHEVYLRLAASEKRDPTDCARILRVASRVMRDVLVDHARRRNALKRGGDRFRSPLESICLAYEERATDLLALDEALSRLAAVDPEAAQIIELRFFGGLSEKDVAEAMSVSPRTVRRGWRAARLWLARELDPE